MRRSLPLAACLLFAMTGSPLAMAADVPQAAQPAARPTPGNPGAPGGSGTAAGGADASGADAAQLHARRTACREEARNKKLVGAQKTTFIKNCIAAK